MGDPIQGKAALRYTKLTASINILFPMTLDAALTETMISYTALYNLPDAFCFLGYNYLAFLSSLAPGS